MGRTKMKAIRRTSRSLFSSIVVVGGLVAFYMYRRQGGRMAPLASKAWGYYQDFYRLLTDSKSLARPVSPTRSTAPNTSFSSSREIPTSPEDLDRIPSL